MYSSSNRCWKEQEFQHGGSAGLWDRGRTGEQYRHSANREYIEILFPGEKGEHPTDPKSARENNCGKCKHLSSDNNEFKVVPRKIEVQIHMIMRHRLQ